MFLHNFKYTLKVLFKNKVLIFWTLAFPLILGTFFKMAFSDIVDSEKLNVIDIAVIDNVNFQKNEIYKEVFNSLSDENNKDRLFNTKYISEEEAKKLLEKEDIIGYLILDNNNKPNLTFNTNGINQTVFKYAVEEIENTSKIITDLSKNELENEIKKGNYNIDYNAIYQNINNKIQDGNANIEDVSPKNLNYMLVEFYTLIAMTCLYGGILTMYSINKTLPNMSSKGKRVSVSSVKKSNIIFSSLLSAFLVELFGVLLLFAYTIFVLNIDFGSNTLYMLLLTIIGTLSGLSLGLFVASVFKVGENSKVGILIAISMACTFLSGMMGVTLKYIIDKFAPIIAMINPANMITDGFYALYYYDTLDRYFFNITSLLIFSFILIMISFISLRRQKYDSI